MAGKRNRLKLGMLVASSNNLKNIKAKRLDIQVAYKDTFFGSRVLAYNVIGIRQFAY